MSNDMQIGSFAFSSLINLFSGVGKISFVESSNERSAEIGLAKFLCRLRVKEGLKLMNAELMLD